MQPNSYETVRLIKTQTNGLRKQLYKNGKNSHKNSYFSDSVKTLHLPFGDTGGMTGQGDPSSWTESTGTTDPLCQCKKGGKFLYPFSAF
jgi:hypothetical protein